jgi:hypothetical protein
MTCELDAYVCELNMMWQPSLVLNDLCIERLSVWIEWPAYWMTYVSYVCECDVAVAGFVSFLYWLTCVSNAYLCELNDLCTKWPMYPMCVNVMWQWRASCLSCIESPMYWTPICVNWLTCVLNDLCILCVNMMDVAVAGFVSTRYPNLLRTLTRRIPEADDLLLRLKVSYENNIMYIRTWYVHIHVCALWWCTWHAYIHMHCIAECTWRIPEADDLLLRLKVQLLHI